MDEGLATGVLTVVLSFATAASGQPQGPQFHDCWTSTRSPSFAIGATADGQALRFDRSPDGFYPWPARRTRETGDVLVQCSAVSDRPIHCFVVDEPRGRFKLGATALEVMSLARLTEPAGVWPLDIDVRFRQSDPGDPTLIPCATPAPTRSARPATSD